MVKFNPGSRVVQMWRDPEEIRQSQQAFYRGDAVEDADTRVAMMRTQLAMSTSTDVDWFRCWMALSAANV